MCAFRAYPRRRMGLCLLWAKQRGQRPAPNPHHVYSGCTCIVVAKIRRRDVRLLTSGWGSKSVAPSFHHTSSSLVERCCGRRPLGTRVTVCTTVNVTINTIRPSPVPARYDAEDAQMWFASRPSPSRARPDWPRQRGCDYHNLGTEHGRNQTWRSGPGSADSSVATVANVPPVRPQVTIDTGPIPSGTPTSISLARGPQWTGFSVRPVPWYS